MSKSELRYLHPSPLDMLPSAVKDAYYSLCHSLEEAVRYRLMSKHDAVKLSQNIKINVQHPRLLSCDGRPSDGERSYFYVPDEMFFDIKSSIIQAIRDDCAILSDYGHLPQFVIDHYLRFRYAKPLHDGSEVAAKLFKIRKDDAVIFDKTEE